MLENDEHKEKNNFTESEIEVLLAELEVRAGTLFESLFRGFHTKLNLWHRQCIAQAVNEVGGAARVPKRRKKKKNEITVQKTCCLLIARFAISSRSANAAILLLAN